MSIPNAFHVLQTKDGQKYLFSSHLESIGNLAQFMRHAIYRNETYWSSYRTLRGRSMNKASALGQHLKHLDSYSDTFSSQYHYHPLLQFFFEEYRNHPINECSSLPANVRLTDGKLVHQIFDDFICELRLKAKKVGLKKKVLDWDAKAHKQRKRLMELERHAFDASARLAVIRLDLHHHPAKFHSDQIERVISEHEQTRWADVKSLMNGADFPARKLITGRVTFEEVQRDRAHFFANLKGKPSLFSHLVGYAWCVEFTPGAGYHLHVVLLFNGAKVRSAAWLAQQIGEYWNRQITQGRGYFENCNFNWQEKDPKCGIGRVDHYDARKREILRLEVLSYITKTSQMVQVLPYKGCNTYGSALLGRIRGRKRGPVRTKTANQDRDAEAPISEKIERVDFAKVFDSLAF